MIVFSMVVKSSFHSGKNQPLRVHRLIGIPTDWLAFAVKLQAISTLVKMNFSPL